MRAMWAEPVAMLAAGKIAVYSHNIPLESEQYPIIIPICILYTSIVP